MSARPRPLGRPRPSLPPPPASRAGPSPAVRAAQCTMHRCWGAADRARTPRPRAAPRAAPRRWPSPHFPNVHPTLGLHSNAPPAVASPIPLTNQCACSSIFCRAALPSPTLWAQRARVARALAQRRSPTRTGWRPADAARALALPRPYGNVARPILSPDCPRRPEPPVPAPSPRCSPPPDPGLEGRQSCPPLSGLDVLRAWTVIRAQP